MKFDGEFFAMPDGTVTAVIRSQWPTADDLVEVLGGSERRGPKRASLGRIPVGRRIASTSDKSP